ncbi:MAG: transporter substrate-binding domain-containing protein [Eubacterium sp.]|nr:transporter substrate-binding domain-containing protein [Candidatus Colimonas fimequi]
MYKRLLTILLALVMAMALTACGSTSDVAEETDAPADVTINENVVQEIQNRGYLVAGCKMDVPDMGYLDVESGDWFGLEVGLAYKTAARIFGVTEEEAMREELVKFVGVTVADREQKLEDGEIDVMLATYTITEDRAKRFALSDCYYKDYVGILVKKTATDNNSMGKKGINSVSDLDGKVIAVAKNSTTRDDTLDYLESMTTSKVSPLFYDYNSYDEMYTAVMKGDVDAMSVDVSILKGYVDEDTVILEPRYASQNYGAAVKLENAPLLEYVNQAIAE